MTTTWDDLVTVALLGTDRRPVPPDLPAGWAGTDGNPSGEPAVAVLRLAARHRAAARAGTPLLTGPPDRLVPPPDTRGPAPHGSEPELAAALAHGAPGPLNDALAILVDAGAGLAVDHWTAAATLAARNPRVDRALLARALGVRGVWFVARNPQWARLATALQARLASEVTP